MINRKLVYSVTMLTLLVAVVSGCSLFPSEKRTGVVTGEVIGGDGQEVEGLDVKLAGKQVKTGADGTFVFEAIPYGRHTLTISRDETVIHNQEVTVNSQETALTIELEGYLVIDVPNASFEEPVVDGVIPQWTTWNGSTLYETEWLFVSDDFASDGKYSLKMDGSKRADGSIEAYSQRIPVTPGTYEASVDLYETHSGERKAHLTFRYYKKDGTRVNVSDNPGPENANTWERITARATVPEDVETVQLVLYAPSLYDGTLYVDNVQLVRLLDEEKLL